MLCERLPLPVPRELIQLQHQEYFRVFAGIDNKALNLRSLCQMEE